MYGVINVCDMKFLFNAYFLLCIMRCSNRNVRHCDECGNVVFFIAMVLPVIIGLAVVAVDVASFHAKRAQLQSVADNLTMTSVSYLPNISATRKYIKQEQGKRSDIKVAMALSGDFFNSLLTNMCGHTSTSSAAKVCDRSFVRDSLMSAAMHATSVLPDVERAKRELKNDFMQVVSQVESKEAISSVLAMLETLEWETHGDGQVLMYQSSSAELDGGSIDVALVASFDISFAGYIKSLKDTSFHVTAHASGRNVPSDVMFVVSDSNSFRPPSGNVWGNASDWPASSYFSLVTPPTLLNHDFGEPPVYWPNWVSDWGSNMYQRWATESCYNPVWSEVKYATISLMDIIGSDKASRTGLLFTPGDINGAPYTIARNLTLSGNVDVVGGGSSQISWTGYFDTHSYLSDELCAYISMKSVTEQQRYVLPSAPNGIGLASASNPNCKDLARNTLLNTKHYPHGKLGTVCNESDISLRKGIYWHAVREHGHNVDAVNVKEAMLQAARMLRMGVNSSNATSDIITRRGNLASVATNAIVVISDALPAIPSDINNDNLFGLLAESSKSKFPIKLIILPVISPLLSSVSQDKLRLNLTQYKRIEELQDAPFSVSVIAPEDIGKLAELGVPMITSALRTAVLWQ